MITVNYMTTLVQSRTAEVFNAEVTEFSDEGFITSNLYIIREPR